VDTPRDQRARTGRPITAEDLLALKVANDPQCSPDGSRVVCLLTTVDADANKYETHLWIVPLDGGAPRALTTVSGRDMSPRWSPDGEQIAFISDRSGDKQVWVIGPDGGESRHSRPGQRRPTCG